MYLEQASTTTWTTVTAALQECFLETSAVGGAWREC